MYTVIKSILDRPSDEVQDLIEQILKTDDILIGEEREEFEFLRDTLPSGTTPSEAYFLDKFPGALLYWADATRLSVQDAKAAFAIESKEQRRYQASSAINAIADEVKKHGFTDEVYDTLRKLRARHRTKQDTVVPYESLPTSKEIYEDRKNRPTGLLAYVEVIDQQVGGMGYGTLNTIMGFVGHFKTTFALNIVYNNAFQAGYNIVYLSFEMARDDLLFNFLSRHSYDPKFTQYGFIGHDRIRQGQLSPDEEDYLLNVIEPDFFAPPAPGETKGKIYILDASQFRSHDIEDIYDKLEEIDDLCLRETGRPLDGFCWDHLQMFKFNSSPAFRGMSEYAVMNAYANQFMNWALKFRGRPTIQILLAQVNREGWKRAVSKKGDYGVYDLTALAEVNEAERASSRVLSVFTDDVMKACWGGQSASPQEPLRASFGLSRHGACAAGLCPVWR